MVTYMITTALRAQQRLMKVNKEGFPSSDWYQPSNSELSSTKYSGNGFLFGLCKRK